MKYDIRYRSGINSGVRNNTPNIDDPQPPKTFNSLLWDNRNSEVRTRASKRYQKHDKNQSSLEPLENIPSVKEGFQIMSEIRQRNTNTAHLNKRPNKDLNLNLKQKQKASKELMTSFDEQEIETLLVLEETTKSG